MMEGKLLTNHWTWAGNVTYILQFKRALVYRYIYRLMKNYLDFYRGYIENLYLAVCTLCAYCSTFLVKVYGLVHVQLFDDQFTGVSYKSATNEPVCRLTCVASLATREHKETLLKHVQCKRTNSFMEYKGPAFDTKHSVLFWLSNDLATAIQFALSAVERC